MAKEGYLYILTNPSMPGLIKIGHTTWSPLDRADALSGHTGVPDRFEVAHCVRVTDCRLAERLVHSALAYKRYSADREFFEATLDEARELIRLKCCDLLSTSSLPQPSTDPIPLGGAWFVRFSSDDLRAEVGVQLKSVIEKAATKSVVLEAVDVQGRYPRFCLYRRGWPHDGRNPRAAVCLQWDLTVDNTVPDVGIRVEVAAGRQRGDRILDDLRKRLSPTDRPTGWWAIRRSVTGPSQDVDLETYAQALAQALVNGWVEWSDEIESALVRNGYILQ